MKKSFILLILIFFTYSFANNKQYNEIIEDSKYILQEPLYELDLMQVKKILQTYILKETIVGVEFFNEFDASDSPTFTFYKDKEKTHFKEKIRIPIDKKNWIEKEIKILHIKNDHVIGTVKFYFQKNFTKLILTKEEQAYLERKKILKIQGLATFPPFNFSEQGQPTGYSVDFIKLIGRYLKVEVEFTQAKSFGETIGMFKKGEIDILPHIAVNQKRKKFIDYTNFDHLNYSIGVTVLKNENISKMSDLYSKTIAVVDKSFIHTFMKKKHPNQKLLPFANTSGAVEAVSLAKADAFIGSIPTMNYYIQKYWLSNVKTTKIDGIGLAEKVHMPMGVQKGNHLLKSILEKVEAAIPHNEIVTLKKQWLDLESEEGKKLDQLVLTQEERAYLSKKKTITMCVLPNWLPFEQIDENGKHKGIGADLIKIISKKTNTPIVLLQTKEWSKSLQNIRERECDILPVAMNIPSRRDVMNFTKPYTQEPFVIATQNNEFFIKDSTSIGSRKIGIVKSYAFIEVLKLKNPQIQIIDVKDAHEGLRKVQTGELFGYVDIMPAVGYNIQKHGMFDLKIAGKLEFDIELSMASRNDEPLLNSIMQKTLNNIPKEQIQTIIRKWIEIKVQQEFDYTKVFYIAGILLIVILLVLYKNRSINLINRKLHLANKEVLQQQQMVNRYVLILNTDLNGIITYANEAYCNAIGFSKEELVGNTHSIMQHPNTTNELISNMWSTISQDKTWIGQVQNYTKQKETKYFNLYIDPLLKDNIKIGYRSISEDVTDKITAELLLKYQESLLSLFDKGDSVLFKWRNDEGLSVEYVSQSVVKLTGYELEEFLSSQISYSSCIQQEDVQNNYNELQYALDHKLDYFKHEPYRIITKENDVKWILDYTVTLKDSNGNVTHFLGYITDITEHIEHQEILSQQVKMASLGEMIGNIAHQWRQPLSLISTVATGTKLHKDLEILSDEDLYKNMNTINQNAQYLSSTIDDFKNFIKGDSVITQFDLNDSLDSFLNLVQTSTSTHHIQIIKECENDIVLSSYPNELIQSLVNIFNNANYVLQEVEEDERYFFITTQKIENNVLVVIKDNGGGIDDSIIDKIFDPYVTTKHQSKGTGLGLNIAYNFVVSGLKGSLTVQNSEFIYSEKTYKGAEFTINIPLVVST